MVDASADDLIIAIEGDGINPRTADAGEALELAGAYLELLRRLAEAEGAAMAFTGLEVRDKCLAIVMRPESIARAKTLVRQAHACVANDHHRPPHGAVQVTDRLRAILLRMPASRSVDVRIDDIVTALRLPTKTEHSSPFVMTELRAELVRIGGGKPGARFESGSETGEFQVSVTREQADQLCHHLYKDVDITIEHTRDPFGRIAEAKLHSFALLDASPEAWTEWFKAEASFWNGVEDIEKELGR
jgi:hypothetical protein